MEFLAFQQCMDFLTGCNIVISSFISDRHTSIAKYMREKMSGISHFFDIWHLAKSKEKH